MSPGLLRRYRADRLLREEFEALRERVIGEVAARLRAAGASVDRADLEAAYAIAWHGLHAAILAGEEIANPGGWLTVVTHRRAIDERRARGQAQLAALEPSFALEERDIAEALDDRARLRALLEAMRARLSERERQAAALCYLQGLSRAEAAARIGVSQSRMRKLMEGTGRGLRGVAAKLGALAEVVAAGEWCERQGSLMRGLAFELLAPGGERHRLALAHAGQCPACRAYVRSLRGLAVVLPPSPSLLALAAASAGASASSLGAGAGAASGVGSGASLGSAPAGALTASGAAGAGAAGGGWWLAGGLGAKLAAGCVLALGLGAGCAAIDGGFTRGVATHRAAARPRRDPSPAPADLSLARAQVAPAVPVAPSVPPGGVSAPAQPHPSAAARASREFGPERGAGAAGAASTGAGSQRTAEAPTASAAGVRAAPAVEARTREGASATASSAAAPPSPSRSAAAREFAPG